ncbi:MAG: hypothetical protein AB7F91_16490 [Parvularculaceae bacterium]
MSLLPISDWTLRPTKEIVAEFTEKSKGPNDPPKGDKSGANLVCRTRINPLDFYAYLRARFGEPNGFFQKLFPANSANLLHWDYYLQCGETKITIYGLTREVRLIASCEMTDPDWLEFFVALKREFGRLGKEKSNIQKSFEKWHIFQNKYAAIADTCAELHGDITDETEQTINAIAYGVNEVAEGYSDLMKEISARANRIYGKCLQLRLLTPILFEAFINYMVLCLAKRELRSENDFWPSFKVMPFHEKLEKLHDLCVGIDTKLDLSTDTAKKFLRVRSSRNDHLHGNYNPESDFIERVYFDGKIPIYETGGDVVKLYWEKMEEYIDPNRAIEDYEVTLLFVAEVMGYLKHPYREQFDILLDDALPGWDLNRKIMGKLFPNELVQLYHEGLKYDDEISS